MAKDNKRNTAIYTAFDDYDSGELPIPERGLLRAILLNAIADMNREDEFARKARAYFLSKEDDYIFSFQSVCSFLNINPHHILVIVGLEQSDRYVVRKPLTSPEEIPAGEDAEAPLPTDL